MNKGEKVSFDANVSDTEGKHDGGLGGDREKPGKGTTGVALRYHKWSEYKELPQDQQEELSEWRKANKCGKEVGKQGGKGGKGCGKHGCPSSDSPRNENKATKKFKSMISKMEAR